MYVFYVRIIFVFIFVFYFIKTFFAMKKIYFLMSLLSLTLVVLSCRTVKQSLSTSDISGEWNIVEVGGNKTLPTDHSGLPFIGFDATDHKIYGNSGCNRMMGTYSIDLVKKALTFGPIAGTRMACPDMTIEQKIMQAMNEVCSFSVKSKHKISLLDSNEKEILVLVRK